MTELTFFDQEGAWQEGILHKKFEKNDTRARCFFEIGRFLTKCRHENSLFFREWTFFDKIWVKEQLFRKSRVSIDFLTQNIV